MEDLANVLSKTLVRMQEDAGRRLVIIAYLVVCTTLFIKAALWFKSMNTIGIKKAVLCSLFLWTFFVTQSVVSWVIGNRDGATVLYFVAFDTLSCCILFAWLATRREPGNPDKTK